MDKVRICLIGCGRAGMIHFRSYMGITNAELVAICDPMEENRNTALSLYPVKYVYSDYRDIWDNREIDAVVVVTPTQFHRDIVVGAARAGKHVFCEKPMADSVEECEEMIEACKSNGVKLQVGFMRRFDKNFQRGKEIIDSGVIGAVTMLKSNTYGPSEPKEWMYDVHKSYGPLGEVNSHDFDTVRWYAGSEAVEVHAYGTNFRSPEKTGKFPDYYDTCSVIIKFANGVLANITGAQYVKYGYDSRTEILGTEGIVKVGSQNTNEVELVTKNREIIRDSMDSWRTLFRDAYTAEDRAFVEAILENGEPLVTGYDGMMALKLVQYSLKSLLENRPVSCI